MSTTTGLSTELVFLILQFLNEEKYKQTVHRLESESGLFCNVNYIEELVTKGDWEVLEKYLAGFIRVNENRYSVKMLFEIRKQRYIEALERKDRGKALEILNQDLKAFRSVNEDVFNEMTNLLTLADIRDNPQLSKYSDNKTARAVLIVELKKLIEQNPDLRDKRQLPCLKNSRLRLLVNQSLNWQHQLCRNPKANPEIATLLDDHMCGPSQAAQATPPMPNQLTGSMLRATFLQPPEAPLSVATSRGQGSMNPPPSLNQHRVSGVLVRAAHNVNTNGDSETMLRRSRHFGTSEEIKNLPTSSVARPTQGRIFNFLPTDDLPKNVLSVINQGSDVKTMDFHPHYQTLLLVGTNTGDISIWEISSRLRIAHKSFSVWNTGLCSMSLQASLTNEHPVLVNRVMWSPDGLLLGVAYSKRIVHIYSYRAGQELKNHLEIEAHAGYVSDLAFTIRNQKLIIITCGEDKTVKVWDAVTGANQFIFEGHNAPVSSICPHSKDNIQAGDSFIFSTSMDGKIKAWLYDEPVSKIDYETPGYTWAKMAYSTDGSRFFSSGTCQDQQDAYLVEWIESEGAVKRTYHGLGKQHGGSLQFDTANRFLAAGDEFSIKFWDMDNKLLLFSTNADGGLPASPSIRFSKDGTLLAVSTSDNGVKILGNPGGVRLIKSVDPNHPEAIRLTSASAIKASTTASNCAPYSSSAGTNIGFPNRSIPFLAMNQDNQNTSDVRGRNIDVVEFSIIRSAKEITHTSQLRSLKLPDNLLPVKIIRVIYTHSGSGILALACNAVHKLWKWQKNEQNTTALATADVAPQLWHPASGILMTNDIRDANMEDVIPCLALSKNNSYVLSASGGKVSLFNLATFKTMTSFMRPPPAAVCLVFHPEDNNILALGMSDSSIHIYNVRTDLILHKLSGHENCVTGLAFAIDKNILVSSGADAQLCVWNTDTWEKLTSKFLKLPSRGTNNPLAETRVHFNPDQTHLMVVHKTQIAVFDPLKLDSCMQWAPPPAVGPISDAVYSCDGKSIFVCIEDGSVSVLTANHLNVKCQISYAAYMPSKRSAIRVCCNAIAAHPFDPNQLALGLSDGGVYVLEPLESDKQWGGGDPTDEPTPGLSTNVPQPEQAHVEVCVVD